MGKSDEVADMSLEMCNDNGGQPYIYIYSEKWQEDNWREELAGKTGGKKWRDELAGRKMAHLIHILLTEEI